MTLSPSIIALSAGSLLSTGFAVYGALLGTRIRRGWDPRSGSEEQLTLERRTYLVSTILALKYSPALRERLPLDGSVDLTRAWKLARYASYQFNIPIPISQPGTGANAFAHESGIHADGALKDRRSYELYDMKDVGRGEPELVETGRIITTGEYGGIKGFRHVYDRLGIHFASDGDARRILRLVQYANLHTQKPLTDDELRFIAQHPDAAGAILTVTP